MIDQPVAYHVSLDVDAWGCLDGGDHLLPVDCADHDWDTPYPAFEAVLPLRWDRGERRTRPDLYWYPDMHHWVCSERAFTVLNAVVPGDIHVPGRAEVDGEPAWVVQVVGRLEGIVDEDASLIDRHPSHQVMQWPAFLRSAEERMTNRLFGTPEMLLDVFMGDNVKAAVDQAGLTGLALVLVDWTHDLMWTAEQSPDERTLWSRATDLASSTAWPRQVPVGLAHLASLLRVDISMRERGLLLTLARYDADQVEASIVAADYAGLPELATAIRSLPLWTNGTVNELEGRYSAAAADDSIRAAFARRFTSHPDEF